MFSVTAKKNEKITIKDTEHQQERKISTFYNNILTTIFKITNIKTAFRITFGVSFDAVVIQSQSTGNFRTHFQPSPSKLNAFQVKKKVNQRTS